MKSRFYGGASLAVVLITLVGACSSTSSGTDDGGDEDATGGEEAGAVEAGVDARPGDTGAHDSTVAATDTGADTATAADSEPPVDSSMASFDTGAILDTGLASHDSSVADTGTVVDSSVVDSSVADTGAVVHDSGVADTGSPVVDSSVADTGTVVHDSGVADTGSPVVDSGAADTGNGCNFTCLVPVNCPPVATACIVQTCLSDCCGTANAASGTACSDNGGNVCDGNGHCVLSNGSGCTTNNECLNGNCVSGICCNTACGGTCQACSAAQTGGVDGTCANVTAGLPAPASQCTANPPCGNDGNCAAGGVCELETAGASCGSPSCSNAELTEAGSCNGAGSCLPGAQGSCPGGYVCQNATSCKTQCFVDADCAGGDTCVSGMCQSLGGSGSSCTANNQCVSGICGTSGSGHCCSVTCPSTVAACGATGCDGTGACVYPGNTVAPASLQTPGDCQKIVCNGNGGATSVDDATDIPTPSTVCEVNPSCQGPSPLTPNFDAAPTGTDCTADGNAPNHVCGDTTNGNIAKSCVECNANVDCNFGPQTTCSTTFGQCQ